MSKKLYSLTSWRPNELRPRLAALAAALLLAPAAWAQAPANDNCSGAIPLTAGTTCTTVLATNVNATASGLALTGCATNITVANNDVWFSVVVPATGVVIVTTSEVAGSAFDDPVMQLYSGSCAAPTLLGCNDDASTSTLFPGLTATGLTPGSTVYARVFGFENTPTGQFNICATTQANMDAAVQNVYAVGKAPVSSPQVVQAIVRNTGASTMQVSSATLSVTGTTTFTDTKAIPALAPGASATVTFAAYTPAAIGNNNVTVTVPADGDATNNSLTYPQAVTANSLSYLNANQPVTANLFVNNTTAGGALASKFTIGSSATVGEVKLSFLANAAAATYQVLVMSATSTGLPNTVLFTSPTLTRPTAAGVVTVPVTGTVAVNGTFFVGVKEISGAVNLGYQVEDPLRPATFYFQPPVAAGWTDIMATPLKARLGIEVGFSSRVLSNRNAALEQALSVFPNPASKAFTLRLPALAGQRTAQLTLLNTLGQPVQARTVALSAAGTDTPVDVSSLAKGVYTLRVQTQSQVATKQVVVE